MAEVNNINMNNSSYTSSKQGEAMNINAHYSENMKVDKPKVSVTEGPPALPKYHLLSVKETNKKLQQINNDIYEGYKKEKSNSGFSFSTFFKIFGGISLAALIVACVRKSRK